MNRLNLAAGLALGVPLALIAGAYGFQWNGFAACEMCWWQRYPHFAAIALGAAACLLARTRPDAGRGVRVLALAAAAAILASGLIGVYHFGVEQRWWEGHTACTSSLPFTPGMTPEERLEVLMRMPMVRCDTPQWTMLGISLAGYNAIVSVAAAIAIALLALRGRRA